MVFNKLNNYILTESLQELMGKVDSFLKSNRNTINVKFEVPNSDGLNNRKNKKVNDGEEISQGASDEKDDYLEILKLRHVNLSKFVLLLIQQLLFRTTI